MIKIMIADDHAIVREGLKKIMGDYGNMQVVAEAGDGDQVLEKLKSTQVDILLLDIDMPAKNGLDIIYTIKLQYPQTQILMLSMYPEEHYAMRAMNAGASGYMTKESVPAKLVNAIDRIANGGKYISANLAEKLLFSTHKIEKIPHEALSDREFQVLRLVAGGNTTKEIADNLSLSAKTISTYRARILEKMDMHSTAELMNYAVTNNLI